MIELKHISFSYGFGTVFDDVSFTLGEKIKVGLVGPNGAGKSTLFKLLTGTETPREGAINIIGTVGFVPQEVKRDPILEACLTIRDYLLNKLRLSDSFLLPLGEGSRMRVTGEGEIKDQDSISDHELKLMLKGLEMEHLSLDENPTSLSGGQKTKLALLHALIAEPDILILDEPTNFLDTEGKKWVMNFLSSYPKTVLLVSHDLELLDEHIEKVLAINPQTHKIDEYKGNYTAYLRLKKEKEEQTKRFIKNEHQHLKQMKKGLEKMARFTSDKGVRARMNLKRRIERIEDSLPEMPKELVGMKFGVKDPLWVGSIPLKINSVTKGYGEQIVLKDISLTIERGERIALLGHNGAGKSTLIKILMKLVTPDSGEVIKDEKLQIGYYSQEFEIYDLEKTVLETVSGIIDGDEQKIRSFLSRFLFKNEKVFQKVELLSGGEKTRLAIAILMLQDHNMLILDEPTTYLDVLSQRIILEALKQYKGTMLIVSHTPEFIKELKPTRALLLPENKVEYWSDDLLHKVGEM